LAVIFPSKLSSAELRGIQIALAMAKRGVQVGVSRRRERAARGIHIFSNIQAGLKALINPRMVSGQVFLEACLELERWCREAGSHVVFHWIPAHVGIDGNERAYELAKEAAVRGSMLEEVKRMVRLGAAANRVVRERAKEKWVQAWRKEKTSRPTKWLVKAPDSQVLRYWKGLRKATSSVLIQLRTGRIGLNQYLTRINIRQDARCGCGLGNQNPNTLSWSVLFWGESARTCGGISGGEGSLPRTLSFNSLI
jgi:ribonuclease HI